jgi:hypothetical protein
MNDDLYVYELAPIDIWFAWRRPAEALKDDPEHDTYDGPTKDEFVLYFLRAKRLAAELLGYEGKMRDGPFIAPIVSADGNQADYMIGWKQESNGTTYVASPVDLPHLRKGNRWAVEQRVTELFPGRALWKA